MPLFKKERVVIHPLKTRTSAKDQISLAKLLLESCTENDLASLHETIKDEQCSSGKKNYILVAWSSGKINIEVWDSWITCRNHLSRFGSGYGRGIFSTTDLRPSYAKGTWKMFILDTSLYLPLSWPFSALPLAAARYSDKINKVINWRLQVGR